ncbi:MAG TPA: hypothetical protein VL978_04965 [Puia sp.]|nr:hypothetical protein [Puia sp.]
MKKEESPILIYYYSISVVILLTLELVTTWYFPLGIALFVLTVLMILDRLGKGIVLRELIALHALFVCVLMPMLGYTIYTKENFLARLWVRYMFIPKEKYFSYTLPAMTLFCLAICWPVNSRKASDQGSRLRLTMNRIQGRLSLMPRTSIYIISIGIAASFIASFLPDALTFVAMLFFWSSFAGVLYLFYTPHFKYKRLILGIFAFFILTTALRNGMFTLVAYMGITMFSFFFLGRKTRFWKKLAFFLLGCFFLFLVQSVKTSYRNYLWRQGYSGNQAVLFGTLIVNKLSDFSDLFSAEAFFPIYYRTNQGYNVAMVIRRFPNTLPYDYGSNLSLSFASSFVPRLFWPDKPEAGGKFNMKYYTGMVIEGWSTNVGPLGEAYGSFGPTGGIIYMFCLAVFIRWGYRRIFKLAGKWPLLIFWIPVMFYQITYSAESDSLQIFNSLVKSAFFVWLLSRLVPDWFGMQKKITSRPQRQNPESTSSQALS